MPSLQVGDVAPEFTLPSHSGQTVRLSDQRGRFVVLFFYPKDNTPGCTREACAFRDLSQAFADANVAVYGISRDPVQSHQKFASKYELTMPLLSDIDEVVCRAYDVLKEKNMYGKISIGIERTTYVLDADGKIVKVFPKVKVDGHAEAVLDFVLSKTSDEH